MANSAIGIPFYVSKDGQPLVGAAGQMEFEYLKMVGGKDKISSAPAISEIGGGWYKFNVEFGSEPFDEGDLIGVIDADKDGNNNLANAERYIPIEARLDFYSLARNIYKMTQNKLTGDMEIKNSADQTILKLGISDIENQVIREPKAS
jgi:hypothetical protein